MKIKGNIIDVINEKIFPGIITIKGEFISGIENVDEKFDNYILPGLIDSHIHIESSMLTPSRFAEAAVVHGTSAVVADPHEIANVLGIDGINYMRKDARQTPLKFFFAAPSCVPATNFETSGAKIGNKEIEKLMQLPDIVALGEMMNFPGVINNDSEVMKKIEIAKKHGKPIDGHCPGLTGNSLRKYVSAGITTEHECTSLGEAKEKARLGMKIMIRDGSSAKNLASLIYLAKKYECFLVSDDLHCDDLVRGHLNLLLKKAVSLGIDPITAIKMVTINPARHYKLPVGLLRKGDNADFVIVNNLKAFKVLQTWINGKIVAKNGKALFKINPLKAKNSFKLTKKKLEDFVIKSAKKDVKIKVIEIVENQIVTKKSEAILKVKDGHVLPDSKNDILKISVAERYGHNNLAVAFINGFGLKRGAIASSVAHDSHNIVVVATNDNDMAKAVNLVREMKGGIVAVSDKISKIELPIAGLMSTEDAKKVSKKLDKIHKAVRKMGCKLRASFTTLSFMALLVIPELKLSDKGLFDVNAFCFTDISA